ncbi:EthD family reductase [Nocardia africana]
MYKLIGTWSAPAAGTEEAFEEHYRGVHVPLAVRVPGLRRIVTTRTSTGFAGTEPGFYRVAEMMFDSPEAMAASSESEEWHAMHADAGQMVEIYGVSLQAATGWEDEAELLA